MIIKRAEIEDAEAIFLIRNTTDDTLSKKSILEEILNANYLVLVAKEEKRVVGFLSLLKSFDSADIMMIATDLDYRNKGIAKNLLYNAIEALKQEGITRLLLEVKNTNSVAINLYQKLGFKQIFVRKNYYNGQFDALIMELAI